MLVMFVSCFLLLFDVSVAGCLVGSVCYIDCLRDICYRNGWVLTCTACTNILIGERPRKYGYVMGGEVSVISKT